MTAMGDAVLEREGSEESDETLKAVLNVVVVDIVMASDCFSRVFRASQLGFW